jgi:hypothetical protein
MSKTIYDFDKGVERRGTDARNTILHFAQKMYFHSG